jgi:hypothetical protein
MENCLRKLAVLKGADKEKKNSPIFMLGNDHCMLILKKRKILVGQHHSNILQKALIFFLPVQ